MWVETVSREMDLAQDLEVREREAAIARVRAALVAGNGAIDCRECGDEICVERLAAMPSAKLCVHCQSLREGKGWRKNG